MIIVEAIPRAIISEAYKTLRTNIQYSAIDIKMKIILITSSEPGEGKSTTSSNLAFSLAEDGKKVLIVDCDLRKPVIHKYFNVSNVNGVSEVLVKKIEVNEAIEKYNDNLYVLTSGNIPPNPTEMLGSKSMEEMLQSLREDFDHIILDSPPVNLVSDAQLLATRADGTLFVIKSGMVKRENVKKAKRQVDKVNGKFIGAVMNYIDNSNRNCKKNYYSQEQKKETKKI